MTHQERIDRRSLLRSVGAGVIAAGLAGRAASAADDQQPAPAKETTGGKVKKAVGLGMVAGKAPLVDKFKLLKELGFDGVEIESAGGPIREEALKAHDQSGLHIHGVMNPTHWGSPLSDPNPAVRERTVESMKASLRDCKAWGGNAVLLVPAVVNKQISYADAYTRSQAEIRKLIPLAEELEVAIAVEDVWNNFLLSPLEMARYVDEFKSPMVRSYFDVGNILRYGWPEQWVRVLGKRIVKIHVKEYSIKKRDEQGTWKGFDVELGEGDCDWPAVMKALREAGFSGWATAEVHGGGRDRLKDIAARMDRLLAG